MKYLKFYENYQSKSKINSIPKEVKVAYLKLIQEDNYYNQSSQEIYTQNNDNDDFDEEDEGYTQVWLIDFGGDKSEFFGHQYICKFIIRNSEQTERYFYVYNENLKKFTSSERDGEDDYFDGDFHDFLWYYESNNGDFEDIYEKIYCYEIEDWIKLNKDKVYKAVKSLNESVDGSNVRHKLSTLLNDLSKNKVAFRNIQDKLNGMELNGDSLHFKSFRGGGDSYWRVSTYSLNNLYVSNNGSVQMRKYDENIEEMDDIYILKIYNRIIELSEIGKKLKKINRS